MTFKIIIVVLSIGYVRIIFNIWMVGKVKKKKKKSKWLLTHLFAVKQSHQAKANNHHIGGNSVFRIAMQVLLLLQSFVNIAEGYKCNFLLF